MATAQQLIEDMGLDYQEAQQAEEARERGKPKTKTICICGHATSRHEEFAGRTACNALMRNCRCREPKVVLQTTDVRMFLSKTEGSGLLHALTRGILAAGKKEIQVSWVDEERYCHKCQATEVRLTPMAVTTNGIPADQDTGYNAFFCDECRIG